jgi:predicted ATP-binding protein involved in virulence
MKMTPVRFVAHKIGPFDHIELNWEKESRYTLIVAENGMGKTTLVTAMAACLAAGNETLFPFDLFARLAHDESSYAYFEVNINGERAAIQRWGLLDSATKVPPQPDDSITKPALFFNIYRQKISEHQYRTSGTVSNSKLRWLDSSQISFLCGAYGVRRDIKSEKINRYNTINSHSLKNFLNPFASIPSSEILQWVTNQHVNYALALAEKEEAEANAYLLAIKRLEQLLSDVLDMPASFKVKRNPFRLDVQQNGTALTVEQLSDGTRSLMSWPLDYLMRASRVKWANPADSARAPGLILVDEIDAHLHPEWQRRVMSMVHQLLPETYIIATTHSPFVLGATDDAQVFRLYKDEHGRLEVESSFDQLYGYPADLILQRQFVPSLYPLETERKLERLNELARKVAANTISASEKKEHDTLLRELSKVNPWLNNLLALSQTGALTL